MPSLGHMEYLGRLFIEAGRVSSNGMGMSPLSFIELEAFARLESLDLEDVRSLRAMSAAYVDGYTQGANALAVPPWDGEPLW